MSQWFYAEGNRERCGPLAAEEIAELFRSGRIALDTLVWREGMDNWQPLRAVAGELGLAEPSATESIETGAAPMPPQLPPVAPAVPAAAASAAPPKQGLSGCAIVGVVGAVAGLFLIAILGVLAAIALPAYQDYTLRAKTTAAHLQLVPLKFQIAEFVAEHGRCPVNDDSGFGAPESYAGDGIDTVRIGRFDNGHCGLEALLRVPGKAQLHGKAIWLDYDTDSGDWECSAEVDDKYLPMECRG